MTKQKRLLTEVAEIDAMIKRAVYEHLLRLGYSQPDVEARRREDRRFRPIKRAGTVKDGQIGDEAWEQIPAHDLIQAFDLWEAINSLDSETKAMFHLWRMGCTHAEIATVMNVSEDSVSRNYDRIRRFLSALAG